MITKKEIALIQKSWAIFKKIDTAVVGDMFYSKLLLKPLSCEKCFHRIWKINTANSFDMLNSIVARLEKLDELKGDIVAMAKRHTDYGVKPEHYNMVGRALLYTLQKSLADEWNEDVKSAWINCYSILAGTMITVSGK